jgi:hypothetical protein
MTSKPITDDEYCVAVGRMVNNAALADACLFSAFRILSGCEATLARAIYYAADALHTRQTMTMRVCDVVGDDEDRRLIQEIAAQAVIANTTRSDFAHSMAHGPIDNIQSKYRPKLLRNPNTTVTRQGLAATVDITAIASAKANKAYAELCKKHGVPHVLQF